MEEFLFDRKWVIYQKIQKLKKEGVNISNIAQIIGVSRDTVYKYIDMTEDDFLLYLKGIKKRKSIFDVCEGFIKEILRENPNEKTIKIYEKVEEEYRLGSSYRNFLEYMKKIRKEF